MPFDLDNVRVFLAAVDHGSFSAAARALRRVPSAVSMTIANLEAELDLQLFDRSKREPKLTAYGSALLPQARMLFEQLQRLNVHAASLTSGLEDSLTLAIESELFGAVPWAHALSVLADEYPLLYVEVLSAPQADALAMVETGRAHLALVFERHGIEASACFEEITHEELVAVVASTHPLVANTQEGWIRHDDLAAERQIMVAGRHVLETDKRFEISRSQWRTDSPIAALELVSAGVGWAWLPLSFAKPALDDGRIRRLQLQNFTNSLRLYVDVVWNKEQAPGLGAQRLIALLKAGANGSGKFRR